MQEDASLVRFVDDVEITVNAPNIDLIEKGQFDIAIYSSVDDRLWTGSGNR